MKGPSPISELSLLDVGKGLVVDEMHGGFIGIAKTILTIWKKSLTASQVSLP